MALALALGMGSCAPPPKTQPASSPTPPAESTTPPAETPAPAPAPPAAETPPSTISAADFKPAFFDFDSYSLGAHAREALDADAALLRQHPDVRITIEGHCDERGTVEYNHALGEKRAQAARDYLTAAGIDASRIEIVSYGKERPFDPGHNARAWAKNRRAHFVLP
ncbi:MAG TPA: peptidoglycan-associated lipoprotein Pal [Candidatus Eisenbacteria bacterium]